MKLCTKTIAKMTMTNALTIRNGGLKMGVCGFRAKKTIKVIRNRAPAIMVCISLSLMAGSRRAGFGLNKLEDFCRDEEVEVEGLWVWWAAR